MKRTGRCGSRPPCSGTKGSGACKSDGSLTYLAPDIAYHANKLKRRFTQLIDVLGADHHGYVKRLKAAIAFLGGNPDLLDIQILQMVRALRGGEEVKMSKRSGKAITLRDLIDEVGTDARFMYVEKALEHAHGFGL